ncbi:hypothetical protein Tco_0284765 [Tanacetum coccineum]
MIKTKDSRTQRQSNLNKSKEARFKISPQELEDHTLGEIVSLKYVCEHGSSESAGSLALRKIFHWISFYYRVPLVFGSITGGLDHVNPIIRLPIEHGISNVEKFVPLILNVRGIPIMSEYCQANTSTLSLNNLINSCLAFMRSCVPMLTICSGTAECIVEGIIPNPAIAVLPRSMLLGESERTIRKTKVSSEPLLQVFIFETTPFGRLFHQTLAASFRIRAVRITLVVGRVNIVRWINIIRKDRCYSEDRRCLEGKRYSENRRCSEGRRCLEGKHWCKDKSYSEGKHYLEDLRQRPWFLLVTVSSSFFMSLLDGKLAAEAYKTANKMSKLDRFLVSKGLLASFPHLSALCLDRNLSDHRPILIKRSQLAIRGNLVDDEWIVDPLAMKCVFLKYFSTQFSSPVSPRICFIDHFTDMLSLEQQADLEQNDSNEEIKSAVWIVERINPLVLTASLLSSFVDIGSF